jgi:cellulose/xylan binding protein with CBM9 domain
MLSHYQIHKASTVLPLNADWNAPAWAGAQQLEITHFRPESGPHRPKTSVKLLYSHDVLHGIFQVHDRYVRCVRSNYFDEVWKDSCVEFFAQPKTDRGYFNFEFNCGGAFLCSYIIDPERTPNGFKKFTKLPWEVARHIQVRTSLPRIIESEISEPIVWTLQFFIPFALFEPFAGKLGKIPGQVWRGNFFKCAEEVSHPHWASWSPVDEFNFHLPKCFGQIRFVE